MFHLVLTAHEIGYIYPLALFLTIVRIPVNIGFALIVVWRPEQEKA